MDLLIDETLGAKRRSEWDTLLAHLSTFSDPSDIPFSEIEKVYGKQQNAHFTSVKHGFRKKLVNRKRQTRQRKLAFEVRNSDDDGSVIELLSDDSSIYSENVELESDISNSDSVDSVQYVLQCNEQRKLPDFNAKVENCQQYLLQNACFNQTSVKENNASVNINNSSVQKKYSDSVCEDTLLSFLELNSTCCSPIKSILENKEIDDDCIINPHEDEVKLTTDKSQISNSENKQLKSILKTNISENSPNIHKKVTVSSAPDSEIDIQNNDVSNSPIERNDKESGNVKSQNSNLSTLQNTKTLATNNKTDLNNKVHLNQSKLLNTESVNNLVQISTVHINEKPKIYSSAARKVRQQSFNTVTESNASVDKTCYIRNIDNNTGTILKESSKNITSNEIKIDSTKSHSTLSVDPTTLVKTFKSVSKLQNVTPKNLSKLFTPNTDNSTSLLKEKFTEQKENRLPKENTTTKKSKDTEKRKTPKNIGTRIFSTDIDISELNVILNSISNVPVINIAENTVNKDNVIKKNKTQDVTTDVAEIKKKYPISSTPNVRALKNQSRKKQHLKENNEDDAITELVSCDQSRIINEHMNDVTKINIQKNADENSSDEEMTTDISEIFETTIVNKESENISKRKNGDYTKNKTSNTLMTENYGDNETTMSETIVNKENKNEEKRLHNRNGQKIITNSRNYSILDTSSEYEVVRPLIKSSRKKKSRENIDKSPAKSNSDNHSSKTVKCRQRLFNSSSEYDEENLDKSIIKSDVLITNSLSIQYIQDEMNMDKENSKNNETHLLIETTEQISNKIHSISCRPENHKKRKLRDSNCGPVKQIVKKHKTIINNNSTNQVTLNGMLEKHKIEQKSVLKTIEYNIIEHESSTNTITNENVTLRTSQEIVLKQKLCNEVNTNNSQPVIYIDSDSSPSFRDEQCNLSRKERVKKKRRRKSRKEIRFIQYSTDDYTNDTDNTLSISSTKNLTPLSLEYFLDDDVF